MPTLKPLSKECTNALGSINGFVQRYEELLEKSQKISLIDNNEAGKYIDDVVKRYKSIKATQPSQQELINKKNDYLQQLKQHVAEVSLVSFSKPMDVASRLKEVDILDDTIDQIVKRMQQPGHGEMDILALTMSISSETSLLSSMEDDNCKYHHHHHHHYYY